MGVKKETTIVFNKRRDLKDDASRVQASEGALVCRSIVGQIYCAMIQKAVLTNN